MKSRAVSCATGEVSVFTQTAKKLVFLMAGSAQ